METSVATIRVNDLARELGIRSRRVLISLPEVGVSTPKGHSSSLDCSVAERLREYFKSGAGRLESSINSEALPRPISRIPTAAEAKRFGEHVSSSGLEVSRRVSEPASLETRLEAPSAESNLRQILIAKGLIRPACSSANEELRLVKLDSALSTKQADLAVPGEIGRERDPERPTQVREPKREKKSKKKTDILSQCDECPHCHGHFLRKSLEKHMRNNHPRTYHVPSELSIRFISAEPPAPKDWLYDQVSCPKCHRLMPSCALDAHTAERHSSTSDLDRILKGAKRFPFKLLPVEQWLRVFDGPPSVRPKNSTSAIPDMERLERIAKLNPTATYYGTEMWKGYWAFEFSGIAKAVLECPLIGNATYVLSGEWRAMISLTKSELRSEYQQLVERIPHTSEWEVRLGAALRKSRNDAPRRTAR
jgi:hypothetical protein